MEKGLWYVLVLALVVVLLLAGSIGKKFHPAKFLLSAAAVFLVPGLAATFLQGLQLLAVRTDILITLLPGALAGVILYYIVFKRLYGFSTFEHELSHALVALLFLRKITKFVVTRHNGGYISYSDGFGGNVGNYFISLGPYVLPTFTLFSVMVRPFLPENWFPWFDFWIGITFSYQMMSNIDELKTNWSKLRFKAAGKGSLMETDIGREGYIFSFILILALKLLILGLLLFILANGYPSVPGAFKQIWQQSTGFYGPFLNVILEYLKPYKG